MQKTPSKSHNTRLQLKQSVAHLEYITHLFNMFAAYCGSLPVTLKSIDKKKVNALVYTSIKFQTLSLPCFNIYREMFYDVKGTKRVPLNISETFTAVSLAYWFMDDGYKSGVGHYICTDSFSDKDLNPLLDMLRTKFGVKCSSHKTTNGPRIYIKKVSSAKFINLVKPFMVPSFYYKLQE